MHSDYHQNLKHHKYTYNQFAPNDKRMHEFMEIENPTHEQVKHYRDIFLTDKNRPFGRFFSLFNDYVQLLLGCVLQPLRYQ